MARAFDPFLVNTVVGFIGPEYLSDERQIIRAGLEDHFMGKLLGLPMGCDVCYTNHAAADQNSADNLLVLLAAAGVNYFMGVPCADDVMLNYQSTSYHDAAGVRRVARTAPAPEFAAWLESKGIFRGGRLAARDGIEREKMLRGVAGMSAELRAFARGWKRGRIGTPSIELAGLHRRSSRSARRRVCSLDGLEQVTARPTYLELRRDHVVATRSTPNSGSPTSDPISSAAMTFSRCRRKRHRRMTTCSTPTAVEGSKNRHRPK